MSKIYFVECSCRARARPCVPAPSGSAKGHRDQLLGHAPHKLKWKTNSISGATTNAATASKQHIEHPLFREVLLTSDFTANTMRSTPLRLLNVPILDRADVQQLFDRRHFWWLMPSFFLEQTYLLQSLRKTLSVFACFGAFLHVSAPIVL